MKGGKKMEEQKYIEEDLTDDEKIQAQFNVDSLKSNLETSEFDIVQMNKQIELNLPQRQSAMAAKEEVRKKEVEIGRFKDQLKMYARRVRTGKKKVPVIDNTPAE